MTAGKSFVAIVALLLVAVFQYHESDTAATPQDAGQIAAPATWSAGDWISVDGKVIRTLSDDKVGSRHQRFIIKVAGGRTLLVAHNIDLAERVPVRAGDRLSLHGRYETNPEGGVVHWTHHDPDDSDAGGWIEFNGTRYR